MSLSASTLSGNCPTPSSPTLTQAFEHILQVAQDTQLDSNILDKARTDFDLLTTRLSVSRIQALIIAMIIDDGDSLTTRNMAAYLNVSHIGFLKHQAEINDLVERKIICTAYQRHGLSGSYEINEEALKCYLNNEVYVRPRIEDLTLQEFVAQLDELFQTENSQDIAVENFQQNLDLLIRANPKLPVCQNLGHLSIGDKIFFFYCLLKLARENKCQSCPTEVEDYMNGAFSRRLVMSLETGVNPMLQRKLLEPGGTQAFSSNREFRLNEALTTYICEELHIVIREDTEEEFTAGLKTCDQIVPKTLYYNRQEAEAMAHLEHLLSEENFKGVQQRLSENGLRRGLACLFYGGPGTGKTEGVLQLARKTGRHLMQVNIASVKSKWVGESEKNIRQIFNRYRNYCEHCRLTPILFFNEADALINSRTEHIKNSVDRMENALQDILLDEIEQLDGILIATTNLTANLDRAFERRFLFKIAFTQPDAEAQAQIWQSLLQTLKPADARALAASYNFSGGQIENIARRQIIHDVLYHETPTLSQLQNFCQSEQMNRSNVPLRPVGFH